MEKRLVLIIFAVFFISCASATLYYDGRLGVFPQDSCVNVRGELNETGANVSIYYPNSTLVHFNQPMANMRGDIWNYSFCNTSTLGEYMYEYCDLLGYDCRENTFEITYAGLEVTEGQAIIYTALLLLLIFFFIITFLGIGLLPASNTRDEEGKIVQISWLKYLRSPLWFFEWILLIGIMFLASNLAFGFLAEPLFGELFFIIYRIMFMLTPIMCLVWMAWFYIKFVQDREFKKMFERGFAPDSKKP